MWNCPGRTLFRLLFALIFVAMISIMFLAKTASRTKGNLSKRDLIPLGNHIHDPTTEEGNLDINPTPNFPRELVDNKYPKIFPNIAGMVNFLQFRYTIAQKDLCNRQDVKPYIFIYVHSDPNNMRYRMLIRKTYGNQTFLSQLHIVLGFMLGKPSDELVQNAIDLENQQYKDIIQEDYVDAYRNLTYKAISSIRWIDRYCKSAKYIVKVDDDMLVNIFSLVRYLRKVSLQGTEGSRSFHCMPWRGMPVIRDLKSKWHVSRETYNETFFPPYCSGCGFIMPREIISELYNATFYSPFIWVDDVYLTGFLAKTAKIDHKDISRYYVLVPEKYEKAMVYGDGIFGHLEGNLQVNNRIQFWEKIKNIESLTFDLS